MQAHHHIPVRTQNKKCLWMDFHARDQVQFETLEDASHHKGSFHESEIIADTLAWTRTKWNICKFVASLCVLRRKPFRVKRIGSIPKAGMPMQSINTNGDHCVRRDIKPVDHISMDGTASQRPGRGKEAQAFIKDHAHEGQFFKV